MKKASLKSKTSVPGNGPAMGSWAPSWSSEEPLASLQVTRTPSGHREHRQACSPEPGTPRLSLPSSFLSHSNTPRVGVAGPGQPVGVLVFREGLTPRANGPTLPLELRLRTRPWGLCQRLWRWSTPPPPPFIVTGGDSWQTWTSHPVNTAPVNEENFPKKWRRNVEVQMREVTN